MVSPRAIEALAGELRSGALVDIAGARHEIMMERDSLREQFWAAFDAFVPGAAFQRILLVHHAGQKVESTF